MRVLDTVLEHTETAAKEEDAPLMMALTLFEVRLLHRVLGNHAVKGLPGKELHDLYQKFGKTIGARG